MTLTRVEEAVLRTAHEEAEAILAEARRSAEASLASESARLREAHERRVAALRAELQSALDRDSGARLAEDRLQLLRLKNELIESVFERALAGVLALPGGGYRQWLKDQLQRLPTGQGLRLVSNARDRAVVADLLRELNRSADDAALAERDAPLQGGFLVQGRRSDMDCSVEALMRSLRESLSERVAEDLFGEVQQQDPS